ncbi:MAG TPA: glycosyltransferase family 39 protein [Tepidisphaeraceae bacterium]|nr:glycosyltransferase family 39 protein [Tepidisphaeraceae bacterium]
MSPKTDELQFFFRLVPVFLGIRLIYAAIVQLIPDEAFYWTWTRHLAAGYFDHPPMIAYLMWLGIRAVGSVEIGVRLMAVLMALGAMVIVVRLSRRVLGDPRAAVWVAVIWLTSPLLAGLANFFTPDTPAAFFSVCALSVAVLIAHRDDQSDPSPASWKHPAGLWLLFGLFTGLALLSKYTAVLLPGSVALAMLFSRKGLAHYRRPWIYLGGILSLVVFLPDIWWNYTHQWASFRFQLFHGMENESAPSSSAGEAFARFWTDVGTYLGGQAGIWTPVLFGLTILVLIVYWRRYKKTTQVERVLFWSATLPLVFFGITFLKSHHGEANWPAFAYFPASMLIARWLSENWNGVRLRFAHAGVQIALGVLVVMHVILIPPVTRWMINLPYHLPHALTDLTGWREYARAVANEANQSGVPVVTNRHEDAGELAFYMPGQPDVWCVGVGSRATAFDYFDEQPDFPKMPSLLWVGGHVEAFEKMYGYTVQRQTNVLFFSGRNERRIVMYLLTRPSR